MARGAREITLLGQNVNAYHGAAPDGRGEWGLGRLVRELAEIAGLARIRYTTSHPRDVDDELIAAHRDVPQLMPYLHLPLQSGSDRILHAMNRGHTADAFRRIVDRLREARPDIAMASDFIVGFPGETAADHAATLDLVGRVGFAHAYAFKYSPRPGTPASAHDDHVSEAVKGERLAGLQQLLAAQQQAMNHRTVGRRLPVLLERRGKLSGQLVGRSPFMQSVHVSAPERLLGQMVNVDITHAHPSSLHGTIATAIWESGEVTQERAAV